MTVGPDREAIQNLGIDIYSRLLNELRLRRDIARPDNQVGKLGSSPAQINNNLATLSDSELTWIWFDAS